LAAEKFNRETADDEDRVDYRNIGFFYCNLQDKEYHSETEWEAREASALRTVVILATTFPREAEAQLRGLIRRYIADAATQEWAMMANRTANLKAIPGVLAEALQATLALMPSSEGQKTA
jgi:hypothetical protein